jgi:hypothetical protein
MSCFHRQHPQTKINTGIISQPRAILLSFQIISGKEILLCSIGLFIIITVRTRRNLHEIGTVRKSVQIHESALVLRESSTMFLQGFDWIFQL